MTPNEQPTTSPPSPPPAAPKKVSRWKWIVFRRLLSLPLELIGIAFLLVLALIFLLRQPSVQNFAAERALHYLSHKTEATITVDSVYIDIFSGIYLHQVFIQDWDCDTLLFAKRIQLGIQSIDVWEQQVHLTQIEIDDAYFNMHRKAGEMMNLDYVLQGLLGKKSDKKQDTTTTKNSSGGIRPIITAQRVTLNQPRFRMNDGDNLTQVNVRLKQLDVSLNGFDIFDQCFEFNRVLLDQPTIIVRKGDTPDTPDEPYFGIIHISPAGWTFRAQQLQLRNGLFALTDEGGDTILHKGNINFKKLRVSQIEGDVNNIYYANDTIAVEKIQLAAREQSGFELQRLQGSPFLFTARGFEIQNLLLQTPNSRLGNYIQMKYKTLKDFENDFVNRVKFKAIFDQKSQFKFRDINYFAAAIEREPILKHNLDLPLYVTGEIGDKVNKLQAKSASFGIGNTRIEGDFSINGLPDIKSSFIDCKITSLHSSMAEIHKILPPKQSQQIPPEIDQFGKIAFKGSFTGFPSDFVAYGKFDTDLGQIRSDLKMDLRQKPKYSGDIAVTDFALGKLIKQNDLGNITFSATVNGQGFNIQDLLADIDGNIEQATYKNYTYKNIHIDGKFDRKYFTGEFAVQDPNIDIEYFNGTVNLNNATPAFNFKTSIKRLDLKKLNLLSPEQQAKFDWIVAGKTEIDLKGSNIDNIEGKINLQNVVLQTPQRHIALDKLEAASFFVQGKRELVLLSDILNARLNGDFNFKDFVPSVQNYLYHYFPYRFKYVAAARTQQVNFSLNLNDPKGILREFVPEIDYLTTVNASGKLNTASYDMQLQADIPHALLDSIGLHDFNLTAYSNTHDLNFKTNLDSLNIKGIPTLPLLALSGKVYNDTIDFDISVAADTAAYRARLDGLLFANRDTLTLSLDTTILVTNHTAWEANTGVFIYKNKDYFKIEDLVLAQGKQSISLRSQPNAEVKNKSEIHIKNINLMDFSYIPPIDKLGIETQITGDVVLDDLFGKQVIDAKLLASNFVFRGQALGDINIAGNKEKASNKLNIDIDLTQSKDYEIKGGGYVLIPEKKDEKVNIDVDLAVKRGNLRFLEAFLSEVVSDTEGEIRGNLSFKGNIEHPAISGTLLARNAATTIDYLQTRYKLHNQTITFKNSLLKFDNVQLNDRDNNTATLNGSFNLNDFKQMSMDIRLETNNFLFLNTKIGQNDAFYGTAYGKGYMTISGPVNQLNFYINATSNRGTAIYLPLTGDVTTTDNRIYTFKEKRSAVSETSPKILSNKTYEQETSGMRVNLDLDITPDAELQMIFDYQAGDIIRARGKGNIQMNVSTVGDFTYSMYGRYEMEEGSYNFTLQNIVNKHFQIEQGGTILFSGNPYDAQLNMNAVYNLKAARSDFLTEAELTSLSETERRELKRRSDMAVALNLSGILAKPDIKFDLRFPESQATRADDLVQSKLKEMLNNDVNELNRQVFGLLVLNRFMPPQRLDIDVKSGSLTTLSEFVSSYLSSMLNEILPFIPEGGEIGVALSSYDNSTSTDINQANAQGNEIEITYAQKINDRIEVQVGGNVDISRQAGSSVFGGDFVVSYKITADGRVKIKAFGKYDNDILTGEYYKAGGGILFSKEFDSLEELFSSAEKRARKQQNK
jgi:hypothetical protein